MNKQDIKNSIYENQNQLQKYIDEKKLQEEKYGVLMDFSNKSSNSANAFALSIESRKTKLRGISSILGTVKSAAKYNEKMSNMLMGVEYRNVVSNITQLQSVISSELRRIQDKISELERLISATQRKISNLQYDYNNYKEEEKDGK